MGSKFTRAAMRPQHRRRKLKKRDHHVQLESVPERESYTDRNQVDMNSRTSNAIEYWKTEYDAQTNSNFDVDPPGAPSTNAGDYSQRTRDTVNLAWSVPHDSNESYYTNNSRAMDNSLMTSSDHFHGVYSYPDTYLNQPNQVMPDERTSRKVKFGHMPKASPIQEVSSPRLPLTQTHSWHEPGSSSREANNSVAKTDFLQQRPIHQSIGILTAPSSSLTATSTMPSTVPPPIYVGIDHKATIAGRGQRTGHKRTRKNGEKSSSDDVNPNPATHRSQLHTAQQVRNPEPTDISNTKTHSQSSRSFEPVQVRLSSSQRAAKMSSSTSMKSSSKQVPNNAQSVALDQEGRSVKSRKTRQQSSMQPEQHTNNHQDLQATRTKSNQRTHHAQRPSTRNHNSPLRTENTVTARRAENKPPGTPDMKDSTHQQHRQKSSAVSSSTAGISRIRV